jgi:hypothetical protein
MTDIAATDVGGEFYTGTTGGGVLAGYSDNEGEPGVACTGIIGVANPTDTTPAIRFRSGKKNGTSWQALGSDETVAQFQNYTTSLMTILGDGNVGINEASPAHKLDVDGGIVEQGGALKENLLTNSGFDVWSNSTLCCATTGAAPAVEDACNRLQNGGTWAGLAGNNTPPTNWTATNNGTYSTGSTLTDGVRIEKDDTNTPILYQAVTVEKGKLYKFFYQYQGGGTSGGLVRIGTTVNGSEIYNASLGASDSASVTKMFEASADDTWYVSLWNSTGAGGQWYEFDNVHFHEVTPACIAADTLAMDTWYKNSNGDIYRWHDDDGTNTHDGSFYGLKFVPNVATVSINWPLAAISTSIYHYRKFESRTVTAGVWMKTSKLDEIRLYEQSSTYTAAAHTGGGGWEWVEVTHTFSASTDRMMLEIRGVHDDSVMYLSQPMLVFGNSIGSGNYTRPQGEFIEFEKEVTSNVFATLTGQSDVAATTVNSEADSNGAIPKGVKSIRFWTRLKDSGSAATANVGLQTKASGYYSSFCIVSGLANDTTGYFSGENILCDENGDYQYVLEASGSGTLDMQGLFYHGVKLR